MNTLKLVLAGALLSSTSLASGCLGGGRTHSHSTSAHSIATGLSGSDSAGKAEATDPAKSDTTKADAQKPDSAKADSAAPTAASPTTVAPSNPVPAPRGDSPEANQTDETAGKTADLGKIATSPRDGSPYLGPKDAPVVVNVFSDFQCPVCKRSADPIKQLVLDFPGMVKVVFRNNALEMHGRSRPAALAAMAAGKQGKFWQYHDRLFANQSGLDDASLRKIAQDLGLDMDQWEKDLADPANAERVKEESSWATKLGAAGTPAFFVNGSRQTGWGSYQGLKSIVAREVGSAEGLAASGVSRSGITENRIRAFADKNTKKDGEASPDLDQWVKVLTAD